MIQNISDASGEIASKVRTVENFLMNLQSIYMQSFEHISQRNLFTRLQLRNQNFQAILSTGLLPKAPCHAWHSIHTLNKIKHNEEHSLNVHTILSRLTQILYNILAQQMFILNSQLCIKTRLSKSEAKTYSWKGFLDFIFSWMICLQIKLAWSVKFINQVGYRVKNYFITVFFTESTISRLSGVHCRRNDALGAYFSAHVLAMKRFHTR